MDTYDRQSPTPATPTAAYYVSVFRRRLRIVAAFAALGLLVGAYFAFARPNPYYATASVVIRPITAEPFGGTDPQRSINGQTERSVMASTVVAERVQEALRTEMPPDELLRHLTVTNPTDTLVLNVEFSASTPVRARQGANAFANAYLRHKEAQAEAQKQGAIEALDRQIESLNAVSAEVSSRLAQTSATSPEYFALQNQLERIQGRVLEAEGQRADLDAIVTTAGEIVKEAKTPSGQGLLSKLITLVAFVALAGVGGLAVALVRHRTDPFMRSRDDFEETLGDQPLGEIKGDQPERVWGGVVMLSRPHSREADAYRQLRLRIWPRRPPKLRRVLVADVSSGRTTGELVANLAVSLAQADWRVLLLWADKSPHGVQPPLHEPVEHLALMPWSGVTDQSGERIDPTALVTVLDESDELIDVALVAGPPVLRSADSLELCTLVDGVVLSFDPQRSKRADVERALEMLRSVGGDVLGLVVDPAPERW